QVDAGGADAAAALASISGVVRVVPVDQRGAPLEGGVPAGYEVESERGKDVRRDLARAVVTRGWGLLELRPMRMSLEEVFLQVTTEEKPEDKATEDKMEEAPRA